MWRLRDVPVMLLYDSKLHPNTGKLTEKLLKFYKKKGYAFKGLDEYKGKEDRVRLPRKDLSGKSACNW